LVLEFAVTLTQLCGCGSENIFVRTSLVLMLRSYSDKTFFFATCDSDEHCSIDATVTLLYVEYVTAVCLYIYTLMGTTIGSWKILLVPWKVLELILCKTVGTLPYKLK